nr:hypothetical protein [Tanacetum cinerariifolium]
MRKGLLWAGSNPGDDAKPQPQSSPVVYARPNLEHIDLEATNVSTQQHHKQMDTGFTATTYPNVQENLKITVEEHSVYDAHRGPLPPVVIREPDSRKFQPLQRFREREKRKKGLLWSELELKMKARLDFYLPLNRTDLPNQPHPHVETFYITSRTSGRNRRLPTHLVPFGQVVNEREKRKGLGDIANFKGSQTKRLLVATFAWGYT